MKYVEKKTTSSLWQEVNSGLRLPYLTICPSYNRPKGKYTYDVCCVWEKGVPKKAYKVTEVA